MEKIEPFDVENYKFDNRDELMKTNFYGIVGP